MLIYLGKNNFLKIMTWKRDCKKRKRNKFQYACYYQMLTKPKKTRVKQASTVFTILEVLRYVKV